MKGLIGCCRNMFGNMSEDCQARLRAVLRDPTPETWDEAYSLIISGFGTLWQAVVMVDDNMPRRGGSIDATPAERWPYVPDTVTIARAIRAATNPS